MIRTAVVGVNNIGNIHCRYYNQHPDTELVAVCDIMEDRAKSAAMTHGVKAYTDLRHLLDSEEIDMVCVATGGEEKGSHHFDPVMAAIEAGKDVLVEKPISNSIEEARTMVQAARERGVRFGCNLNHRFTPAASKGREWIDRSMLGAPLFINMRLTIDNKADFTEWFHMRALHPHSIDVMRYFFGDVKRVQSFMCKAPGRKTWSTASVNMEFANGAVGHLTGSYDMSMLHPIEWCEAAGTEGRFVIENVYESITYYPRQSSEKLVMQNSIMRGMQGFNDTFGNRINRFIDQLKQQVAPEQIEGSGAEALAAQEIIEAAIRSHQSGGNVVEVPAIR
ncbi:gfo/Idh/MocA family oxidoreductase [Paenibacillus sp. H1-7]|uniref:Gfo/Idh/MocA family protein n=1 Tax=Paenibacillus sp. H1-7 TaxID=2282849 RepID=UPI001EF89727|nr:Gfo/Idh/MocA family oxidoreductase [Paenibacillus sp. H1-7]ULL15964.1 gfo/Idh/MocA family oxidoreductase [Paenibacillus sp. H1-7]